MPIAHRIIPKLTDKETERFWSMVIRGAADECWLWKGHTNGDGYGSIGLRGGVDRHRNHMFPAHRIAFSLGNSAPPPPGILVCHTCDTPNCVNPKHLFLGTQTTNMRDMLTKGRGRKARGEGQHLSKITEQQVREIRSRYRRGKGSGSSAQQLGPEYGITPENVLQIVSRKTWKHVA
jgi:hypothetical protein